MMARGRPVIDWRSLAHGAVHSGPRYSEWARCEFVLEELDVDLCPLQFLLSHGKEPLRSRFVRLSLGSLQLPSDNGDPVFQFGHALLDVIKGLVPIEHDWRALL